MPAIVLIRGAGDLASGVALRLRHVGVNVAMSELEWPLAVRRTVSFAEAIYEGSVTVEGVTARRLDNSDDLLAIQDCLSSGQIPVLVDPACEAALGLHPPVIVDARMTKQAPTPLQHRALLYIGLGPGFTAPENCDAVIETERGHTMGRVIWRGSAREDSMRPDGDARRVIRAPATGVFETSARIGQHLDRGDVIGLVSGETISAPFPGTLRGLLRPGMQVRMDMKIGDIDARDDPSLCTLVSDKSLAVGGGVLEAILATPEVRAQLWA